MIDNMAVNSFYSYARFGFDRESLSIIDIHKRIIVCCCSTVGMDEKQETQTSKKMLAVYDTLRLLSFMGRKSEIHALYAVYFTSRGRKPKKMNCTLEYYAMPLKIIAIFERYTDV